MTFLTFSVYIWGKRFRTLYSRHIEIKTAGLRLGRPYRIRNWDPYFCIARSWSPISTRKLSRPPDTDSQQSGATYHLYYYMLWTWLSIVVQEAVLRARAALIAKLPGAVAVALGFLSTSTAEKLDTGTSRTEEFKAMLLVSRCSIARGSIDWFWSWKPLNFDESGHSNLQSWGIHTKYFKGLPRQLWYALIQQAI